MKVLFFGTPPFAAEILSYLLKRNIEIAAVITKPDRPKGRSHVPIPSAVKEVAIQHSLPLLQPPKVSDEAFAPTLRSYGGELFVVVAYGEIIKQHLLDMPQLGAINVHASLLPKYRGAAPIQRCIIDGATESGITIMKMERKMDAGEIIKTVALPIELETTFGELENALCLAAQQPLFEVIEAYRSGHPPPSLPQDHSLATFAPKIELDECQIDWNKTAHEIHNLIRGVNPVPGAWCYVQSAGCQKRLKIFRSYPSEEQSAAPGAMINVDHTGIDIACGHGTLKLLQLQLEGKRRMDVEEFVRGFPAEGLRFLPA